MKIPKPFIIAHLQNVSIKTLEYNFAMTIDVDIVPVTKYSLDGGTDRVTKYTRTC